MLGVLHKGAERLELDCLQIQPTYWCRGGSCSKRCYVKARCQDDRPFLDSDKIGQLIDIFTRGKEAFANQITVSIDQLPHSPTRRAIMHKIFDEVFLASAEERDNEIHITVRDSSFLQDYQVTSPSCSWPDIISLSNPFPLSSLNDTFLKQAVTEGRTKINHNCMLPSRPTKKLGSSYFSTINSVYLTYPKTPIGASREPRTDLEGVKLAVALRTIQFIRQAELNLEINIDSCLLDIVKYYKTGYGCSANISKFHIWPDGSVSGCPYAYRSCTPPAEDVKGILKNIRLAQGSYDFKSCYLARTYCELVEKSPKFLNILEEERYGRNPKSTSR